MARQVLITKEEDWLVATDISSQVASQGKSLEEAMLNLKEALELYLDGSLSIEQMDIGNSRVEQLSSEPIDILNDLCMDGCKNPMTDDEVATFVVNVKEKDNGDL